MTVNGMGAIVTWAHLIALQGGPESAESLAHVDDEKQAYDDIKSGCYFRFDIHIVCRQIPPN